MEFSFDSFVHGYFDYDPVSQTHTGLWLHDENMDIGGGRITVDNIDRLKDFPNTDVVTISGLQQDTFEYFIRTYGRQLKAIRFFKNKLVEDWSLLGTLPDLKYVHFFSNQRIEALWDMSGNKSLSGLCIEDFSRLHSINGINTAPVLKEFSIGNAVWSTMTVDSLMPLENTGIEKFKFYGKTIVKNDFSFLATMNCLKVFDFPTNMLSTEQVAWITTNFPHIEGFALKAKHDCNLYDSSMNQVPGTIIVGKRKPSFIIQGNEKRIERYVLSFQSLKQKYKNVPYKVAFPD